MVTPEKAGENALRRMAERRGLTLKKSRRRDPRAPDYDTWMIMDWEGHACVVPNGDQMTPDEVEAWLTEPD